MPAPPILAKGGDSNGQLLGENSCRARAGPRTAGWLGRLAEAVQARAAPFVSPAPAPPLAHGDENHGHQCRGELTPERRCGDAFATRLTSPRPGLQGRRDEGASGRPRRVAGPGRCRDENDRASGQQVIRDLETAEDAGTSHRRDPVPAERAGRPGSSTRHPGGPLSSGSRERCAFSSAPQQRGEGQALADDRTGCSPWPGLVQLRERRRGDEAGRAAGPVSGSPQEVLAGDTYGHSGRSVPTRPP